MFVEEEEVGVRVVADPGRGRRDREVGQEGGRRGGVLCRVDLHNHGAGLFNVDDGVVEALKKGCAGDLGVFGGGELKSAGMGRGSLGNVGGARFRYFVVVGCDNDVAKRRTRGVGVVRDSPG